MLLEEFGDTRLLFGHYGVASVAVSVEVWCTAKDVVEFLSQCPNVSVSGSREHLLHTVCNLHRL